MSKVELQLPALYHKTAAEDFKKDFFEIQENYIPGCDKFHDMGYEAWLTRTVNNRQKSTVSSDSVVRATFFAVRKCDNKIIGIIDIRHSLGDDVNLTQCDEKLRKYVEYLKNFGGHIGYSVRPSERNRGYATEMLKIGLEYAKSLNIERVMIGCYSDNPQSIKTIEKCGGVLSETKTYTDGNPMNIYYVSL
jgi:predicted acetyltransferase